MPKLRTKAESSSPGKLILVGEHSVLYGYKSIAFPLDKHITVNISKYNRATVLRIKFENKLIEFNVKEVSNILIQDKFYALVIKTINSFYQKFPEVKLKGLNIKIDSDLPIGGFGSSTALVSAMLKTLCLLYNIVITNEDLIKLIIEIESTKEIKVSGLDQTVIVENSPISFIKENGVNVHKKLFPKNRYIRNCIVIDTGRPNEVTSEVVKFVREQYNSDTQNVKNIFNSIGKYCLVLERQIQEAGTKEILDLINYIGEQLVNLGIVTTYCQEIMSDLKKLGASVKISGAGAVTGNGCGALICFSTDQSKVTNYLKSRGLNYFTTTLF